MLHGGFTCASAHDVFLVSYEPSFDEFAVTVGARISFAVELLNALLYAVEAPASL